MREWLPERLRESIRYGLQPFLVHKLSREIRTHRTLEGWVSFAVGLQITVGPRPFRVSLSCRSNQIPSEIKRLLELVAQEHVHRVLEVGSAGGGTLFLFARAAASDAFLVGMDLPQYTGGGLSSWRAAIYEKGFTSPGQRIRIILGNSHDETTRARVEKTLGAEPVDFLFIDADHTYEGVRRDFEMYAPLVRPGGLIALHDIEPDSFHRTGVRTGSESGEVFRYWRELKEHHPNRKNALEIVEKQDQDGFGIGVLRA